MNEISTEAIDALLDEAWQIRSSDPARAEALAGRAEEASRALEPINERGIGRALVVRAACAQVRSDVPQIIALAEAAQEPLRRANDRYWLAEAIARVGIGLTYADRHAEALDEHDRALAVWRELGEHERAASVLNNIGVVYTRLHDFERAIEFYEQSLSESVAAGDAGQQANTLSNIGAILFGMGRADDAIAYLERAIPLLDETGSLASLAQAYLNLGATRQRSGETDAAETALRRAHDLYGRLGSANGVAMATSRLGAVERSRGNPDVALALHRQARQMFVDSGNSVGDTETLLELAEDLAELGRIDEAIEHLEESLASAGTVGATQISADGHYRLATVYEKSGNLAKALEHERAGSRLERETITSDALRRTRDFETARQIELARKEAEIERLRNVELATALQELKSAQAQLVHAEKMSSLGQLTAGVAHEINNPVNFIRASVPPLRRDIEALLGDGLDDDERAETLEEIRSLLRGIDDGASRTAEIVRGLRTFSRLDEDELKEADLHEGLEATLTLLRPRLDGVSIVRRLAELHPIECRPGQINQVFMNLLSNAADACEGGGTITITTAQRDGHVEIAIADTGHGIDDAHRDRIFEPFFTTRKVGEGQGLGLAIAHSIVQAHGGSIDVESARGVGSTFTVRLPRVARHSV